VDPAPWCLPLKLMCIILVNNVETDVLDMYKLDAEIIVSV
jgi:hypothetical protein